MSSHNEIPWSAKPKNGIRAFFTEETFNKWIGQDTHESRMEERLNKIGISLSSRLTGPLFLTPSTSAGSECNVKEKTDAECGAGSECNVKEKTDAECGSQFSLKAEFNDEGSVHNKVKEESSHFDVNSLSVQGKETAQNDEELHKQSNVLDTRLSQLLFRASIKAGKTEEVYPVEQKFVIETNGNNTGKGVGIHDNEIVTDTEEVNTGNIDTTLTCRTEPETSEFNEDVESIAMETEYVKPFSFYKESCEENLNAKEDVASKDSQDTGTKCIESGVNRNLKRSMAESMTSETTKNVETTKQADEPMTEEEERKLQKQLLNQDKMFFNIRDRNAEKYFADVFKKRPRNRHSKLTCQEQKHYLELFRCFGKVDANTPEIQNENFKKYLKMKVIVSKEQELFQNYLRSISFTCKKDYEYIHPEVEKYVNARFLVKRRECFNYPRFYNSISKFDLPDTVPETPPTLQYVRPLLELIDRYPEGRVVAVSLYLLVYNFKCGRFVENVFPSSVYLCQGIVRKLVLPSIFPGLPQPCVTTSFKRINELCPIIKGVYKGTYVWNKVVCSQDANAEQLAVPNKCDFVMPSSAVKRLVDNQGKIFKYWDMPFTVREYKITEGGKTTIHKVIYIDKPQTRQTQNVPKDNIQLYQKHAIRASAIKSNARGHVFCGIKPVHELVKMPTFEEIQLEINDYEGKIKEAVNKESVLEYDGEEGSPKSKAFQKRKRKLGQVGVFDLENDIDDLETFGMDSVLVSKGKSDGDKGMHVEPLKSSREKTKDSCTIVKRGRKSTKEDLETLKNELECIKSQAIMESFKRAEIVKDKEDNKQETTDHILGSADIIDNLASESSRGKENDNDLVLQNENKTADSYDAYTGTRKEKKDILNVKSISSLSEKMKQMSTVKSKLQQRMKGHHLSSLAKMSDEAGVAESVSSEVKGLSDNLNVDVQCVAETSATDRIDEDKNEAVLEQNSVETASDSDSEDGGLVIDVQSDSPVVKARNRKPSSDNTGSVSVDKTISFSRKEGAGAESDKCIVGDSLSVKAGEKCEESIGKEKINSGKRRITTDYAEDISVPKRILRSNRKSASDALESAKQAVVSSNEEDRIMILGECITSVTEGKSQPKTGVPFPGSQEEHIDKSVPVKRGRGRPKKQLPQGQKHSVKRENISEQEKFTEMSKDVSEESSAGTGDDSGVPILVNEIRKESIVETKMHSGEDEGNPEIKNDQDTTLDEEVPRRRRRSIVRKLDSDEYSKDATDVDPEKYKKEPKKDIAEYEARKIKEISEAMRKRIEETKKKIREEKRKKIQQSGKSKSEKSNKMSDLSEKTDHSQGIADDDREVKLNTEEKKKDDFGQDQGLENILKLQDKMHQSSTNKGTLAEVFTQKHGMSHCGFPLDDNVTYHQWNLAGINLLIRCKYHGFITGQGLVHISPKVEYQPNFGYEQDTVNEICKNWISVYIRPNSSLLKSRINPFNSEIMMFEHVAYNDLVQPDSLFKPAQAFTDLHEILDKLKSLPVGQYLLKNNPREDQFTILKASEHEERGSFDLHLNQSSFIKSNKPVSVQWTPLDTTLMLPHQRKMNFIPCTFQPKDAKVGEKKQEKNKKKKKRKKNK